MVAIVAFVIVARRMDWFAGMRRHPLMTAVVVLGFILVFAPLTWYLASPLVISTSVVEAAPPTVAPVAAAPTAPPPAGAASTTAPAAAPSVGAAPQDPVPTASVPPERSGTFKGADEFHFGSGMARLIPGADGAWTLRFEDFAVRNGPDLYVYLSTSGKGYAKGALEVGKLKADTGAFNYKLPAGTDPQGFASVVVWCKQFAVQFAHARLTP